MYLVQILCRVQFSSCAAEAGDYLWDKVRAVARPLPGGPAAAWHYVPTADSALQHSHYPPGDNCAASELLLLLL